MRAEPAPERRAGTSRSTIIHQPVRPKNRHTTPPKVLPLLPIALIAIWIGELALGMGSVLLMLTGIESSGDAETGALVSTLITSLIYLVALSFVLRWLVERWVGKYPPLPGPRHAEHL